MLLAEQQHSFVSVCMCHRVLSVYRGAEYIDIRIKIEIERRRERDRDESRETSDERVSCIQDTVYGFIK